MTGAVPGVLVLAAAHLLGSIPFSYLVARRRGIDVRTVGSGNVGATNVMRSAGKAAGLLAFALDFLKGVAATSLARAVTGDAAWATAAAIAAVLGHMYPVWLRFRGGKGVATGAGVFLLLAPVAAASAFLVFGLALALTRYVSLASLSGAFGLALASFATGAPVPVSWAALAMAGLITWKHRENLRRIAAGTENRLGARKAAAS